MVIMDAQNSVGGLEAQAISRKERLKNLKRKHTGKEDPAPDNNDKMLLPKPKFRSYTPQDSSLMDAKLENAAAPDVEEHVQDLIEAGKEKVVLEDMDITSLAPRKPDWDLKRDVAKKLEKLERRTQKAIAELIWERLHTGKDDNLSAMVSLSENKAIED